MALNGYLGTRFGFMIVGLIQRSCMKTDVAKDFWRGRSTLSTSHVLPCVLPWCLRFVVYSASTCTLESRIRILQWPCWSCSSISLCSTPPVHPTPFWLQGSSGDAVSRFSKGACGACYSRYQLDLFRQLIIQTTDGALYFIPGFREALVLGEP